MQTTETLRDDILKIRDDLRAGRITNTVARTLISAAKEALASLKLEIEAARLGAGFSAVELSEKDRNARHLRSVA